MKIIYLLLISSLLSSCHILKPSKQDRLNQFQPSEKTYQASVGSTTLSGIVTESQTKDPVIYGSIALYQNGVLVTGTETGFDGKYVFSELAAGVYDLEISYVGFPTKKVTNVEMKKDFKTTVNVEMSEGLDIPFCGLIYYEVPLVEQDNTTSGQTLTSDQIRRRRSSN